jgi:hypothetical protein
LYWRRSAFGGPYDTYNATLAGHRLVQRFGPERGGIPDDIAALDAKGAELDEKDAADQELASKSAVAEDATDDIDEDADDSTESSL